MSKNYINNQSCSQQNAGIIQGYFGKQRNFVQERDCIGLFVPAEDCSIQGEGAEVHCKLHQAVATAEKWQECFHLRQARRWKNSGVQAHPC